MADFSLRLIILVVVCVLVAIAVVAGRMLVARRRQQALAAEPLVFASSDNDKDDHEHLVRILAFSSEDCRQCHTLQQPALERLLKQSGDKIEVVHVDAVTRHDLTERYKVLTVPTTVVLDTEGNAHAVNYGFANTQKLQEQVNAILGLAIS
ncbi:hypothetical protein KDH_14220 [Dictyobacter sp. S3.2.2.5]|uniref:Thioredoxin domain-containing protein n=1 Tax=Dictyobacter halimunensis TaxID=3026934 RepID=A0ABQ6FLV7_9CHLR|nr:hypothetical protein KDH_14220 [Dictyobacter sp. S3.2.2.5]